MFEILRSYTHNDKSTYGQSVDSIKPGRSFLNYSVDFANSYLLKNKTHSKLTTKLYECNLVYCATKAVYIVSAMI